MISLYTENSNYKSMMLHFFFFFKSQLFLFHDTMIFWQQCCIQIYGPRNLATSWTNKQRNILITQEFRWSVHFYFNVQGLDGERPETLTVAYKDLLSRPKSSSVFEELSKFCLCCKLNFFILPWRKFLPLLGQRLMQ
jgi:hypothetical protein